MTKAEQKAFLETLKDGDRITITVTSRFSDKKETLTGTVKMHKYGVIFISDTHSDMLHQSYCKEYYPDDSKRSWWLDGSSNDYENPVKIKEL